MDMKNAPDIDSIKETYGAYDNFVLFDVANTAMHELYRAYSQRAYAAKEAGNEAEYDRLINMARKVDKASYMKLDANDRDTLFAAIAYCRECKKALNAQH